MLQMQGPFDVSPTMQRGGEAERSRAAKMVFGFECHWKPYTRPSGLAHRVHPSAPKRVNLRYPGLDGL